MHPETIGRYEILAKLDYGSTGNVYIARLSKSLGLPKFLRPIARAIERRCRTPVALKVLREKESGDLAAREAHYPVGMTTDERESVARFRLEVAANKRISRIRHPNLVRMVDYLVDENSGTYYVAFDRIHGKPLYEKLGRMPLGIEPEQAAAILADVAAALQALHKNGIVHGDLSLSNILIDHKGTARLYDLGAAEFGASDSQGNVAIISKNSSGFLGMDLTRAPEVWERGTGGSSADQYSLGCVGFALLTGKYPFQNVVPGRLKKAHLEMQFSWPSEPNDLIAILKKAVDKQPNDRYPNCKELRRALIKWLNAPEQTAAMASTAVRSHPLARAGAGWVVAVICFLAFMSLLTAKMFDANLQSPKPSPVPDAAEVVTASPAPQSKEPIPSATQSTQLTEPEAEMTVPTTKKPFSELTGPSTTTDDKGRLEPQSTPAVVLDKDTRDLAAKNGDGVGTSAVPRQDVEPEPPDTAQSPQMPAVVMPRKEWGGEFFIVQDNAVSHQYSDGRLSFRVDFGQATTLQRGFRNKSNGIVTLLLSTTNAGSGFRVLGVDEKRMTVTFLATDPNELIAVRPDRSLGIKGSYLPPGGCKAGTFVLRLR